MSVRVLITDNDLGDSALEREALQRALGAEVTVANCKTEADVLDAIERVDPEAIVVQWAPITARVLEAATSCRMVSRIGIGLDMVDLDAATARGVIVKNVPHYCTEEVATHAVAMALSLWRRLPQFDRDLRAGRWEAATAAPSIRRLSSSTVGLIGMGRIGRLVADAFAVWGATVLVHDPVRGDDPYERVTLDRLAAEAEIITLHAPLLDSTRHIIDADLLKATGRTPLVVNVSRGPLIDTVALAEALAAGRLSGAGLDVFETEPLEPDHPIRSAPNTILTPHAAWCSRDALPDLRLGAAQNVIDVLGQAAEATQ